MYTRRAGGSEDLMPIRYQDELEACNSARKLSHTPHLADPEVKFRQNLKGFILNRAKARLKITCTFKLLVRMD